MICRDCLVYWWYRYSYFIMIIDQWNVGSFAEEKFFINSLSITFTHIASMNFFFNTFCIFKTFVLISSISFSLLTLESSVICLTCFGVSSCFLSFLGCSECWLPLISECHMPHALTITTYGTFFTETFLNKFGEISLILVTCFLCNES